LCFSRNGDHSTRRSRDDYVTFRVRECILVDDVVLTTKKGNKSSIEFSKRFIATGIGLPDLSKRKCVRGGDAPADLFELGLQTMNIFGRAAAACHICIETYTDSKHS
jgi:hypothetical protein